MRTAVLRYLINLCFPPRVRYGRRRAPQGRFGDARFTSFMTQNNRGGTRNTNLHDAALRGRKFMKNILRLTLLGGGAWVVLESAKALSVF